MSHQPQALTWTCSSCGEPWPCEPRQARFLDDYVGQIGQLRALMATYFISALDDLTDEPMEEVHRRFVGWVIRR